MNNVRSINNRLMEFSEFYRKKNRSLGYVHVDIHEGTKKCVEKMRSKRKCRPTTRRRYLEKHGASSNT